MNFGKLLNPATKKALIRTEKQIIRTNIINNVSDEKLKEKNLNKNYYRELSSNRRNQNNPIFKDAINQNIDFSTHESLSKLTTEQILRGAIVYQFCTSNFLVNNSIKLFKMASKFTTKNIFERLMQATFYGHFATSHNSKDILTLTEQLWNYGIGTSLAYSVEGDTEGELDDVQYKSVFEETQRSIDIASKCKGETSVCLKLTAFIPPRILLKLNEVLEQRFNLFEKLFGDSNIKVYYNLFQNKLSPSKDLFTKLTTNKNNFFDIIDWNSNIMNDELFNQINELKNFEATKLNDEEMKSIQVMLERLQNLAENAIKLNVKLIVDAEHTYFQTAINAVAMELMKTHNNQKPTIVNTYQNYLKKTRNTLHMDLELSKRLNFHFGNKMVRGAYMNHERERARALEYEDPIQDTYDDTTKNYEENVMTLLKETKQNPKVSTIIAGHNEDTIYRLLNLMNDLQLNTSEHDVTFAQLMGMCDHVTYALSNANIKVYKYVPYGPVMEVLPYLHRRTQENQSVLDGRANIERKMYLKEFRRRFVGF